MGVPMCATVVVVHELACLEVDSSYARTDDVASVICKLCLTLTALIHCHDAFGTYLAQKVVMSGKIEDSKSEMVSRDESRVFDFTTQQVLS